MVSDDCRLQCVMCKKIIVALYLPLCVIVIVRNMHFVIVIVVYHNMPLSRSGSRTGK